MDRSEINRRYRENHPDIIKRSNKKWNPINNPIINKNQIRFKDKKIYLGFNPKTGVCSLCRYQGKTHMHHIKYHPEDPLKDTIELCISCHNTQRRLQSKLGRPVQIKGE